MDEETTRQREAFFTALNGDPEFVKKMAGQMNTFVRDEFEVPDGGAVVKATEGLDAREAVAVAAK